MSKQCCGNCQYSCYDSEYGYVCANYDSEHYAEFVEYEHSCEEYEEKVGVSDEQTH